MEPTVGMKFRMKASTAPGHRKVHLEVFEGEPHQEPRHGADESKGAQVPPYLERDGAENAFHFFGSARREGLLKLVVGSRER